MGWAFHHFDISIHGPPLRTWKGHADVIRKVNLRIGYRLQLVEASWPKLVTAGQPFQIRTQWRNAGVAPCYPGGSPAFTLRDSRSTSTWGSGFSEAVACYQRTATRTSASPSTHLPARPTASPFWTPLSRSAIILHRAHRDAGQTPPRRPRSPSKSK